MTKGQRIESRGEAVDLLRVVRCARSLYFYAFDLLAYDGKDLRKLPLIERRTVLEEYALANVQDPVRLSAVFTASFKQDRSEGASALLNKKTPEGYTIQPLPLSIHTSQPSEFMTNLCLTSVSRDQKSKDSTDQKMKYATE